VVNNSASHVAYTNIAIDKNATGTFLLAANFAAGTVDVFDSTFNPAHLAGSFTDSTISQGLSPFGVQASVTRSL
jgi:DNA-binding beta-propeller fold protein YncE